MSLHDPDRRPEERARVLRRITLSAWAVVAALALATAVRAVPLFSAGQGPDAAATTLFTISIFAAVGALILDLSTARRRGASELEGMPRLPGAWFTGAGIGTLIAAVLTGRLASPLTMWGLLMLAVGLAAFFSPHLVERYRAATAIRHDHVRSTGAHALATVTNARMVSRNDSLRFRVTLRFTDQEGSQRWFTRTAPLHTVDMSKDDTIPMHYDPQNPSNRRTLVVDWPTYD